MQTDTIASDVFFRSRAAAAAIVTTGVCAGFFGQSAMENADVAFVGGIFQKGVYTVIGGTVSKVADLNTSIPGQDGFFSDFGAVAIGAGKVVFVGIGEGGVNGLYTNLGGSLSKFVQVSDTLGGKQVTAVSFGRSALASAKWCFVPPSPTARKR
jgi:hypothetical protein